MKKCASCAENAAVVYFPGNVKGGVAYCSTHFPKNIHKYYGTEYVVSAYSLDPPAPVPVQVADSEPTSEEGKKRSKKKVSTEDAAIEDVTEDSVAEESTAEVPEISNGI